MSFDQHPLFETAKQSYKSHLKMLHVPSYHDHYLKYKKEIDDYFQQVIVLNDRIEYRIEGKLHRNDDLPTVIYHNGTRKWYRYGALHRGNNLPAIVYSDGECRWYFHNTRYN